MKGKGQLYHAYVVVDKAARGGETVLKHLEYVKIAYFYAILQYSVI